MLTFIFSCLCVHTQFVTSCNSAGDSSAAAAARRRRCLKTKSWLTSRPTPAQACAAPRGPLLPSHGTYYSLRYEKRASERAGGGRYVLGALVTARLVGTGAARARRRIASLWNFFHGRFGNFGCRDARGEGRGGTRDEGGGSRVSRLSKGVFVLRHWPWPWRYCVSI